MSSLNRSDLIRALPYARRYARALSGSQPRGDSLVAETLRDLLDDSYPIPDGDAIGRNEPVIDDPRYILYQGVTRRYRHSFADQQDGLSSEQLQLLLLTSLEDVPVDYAAAILELDTTHASSLLADARTRLRASAVTDVMIIEDEPIIAMDLEELVQSCGHRVVATASTEAEAVALAKITKPGLILADINLGIGGDGSNAVAAILKGHYAPVIFVTAYPERLLTGDTVEPAFIITKPFEALTLAIATYQAVTGGMKLDAI